VVKSIRVAKSFDREAKDEWDGLVGSAAAELRMWVGNGWVAADAPVYVRVAGEGRAEYLCRLPHLLACLEERPPARLFFLERDGWLEDQVREMGLGRGRSVILQV
jgi:hypothetical protein